MRGGGIGVECIVLARTVQEGLACCYAVEDLGEEWRCDTAVDAEQTFFFLQPRRDILLLLPCPESRAFLRQTERSALLSPPFVVGLGMDAPDGRIGETGELLRLTAAWRREGRVPQLALRHLPAAMEIAAALFRAMQVPARLRAWAFLPEMVALTVVYPPLLENLRHGLYPMIARRHGMTAAGVERSLRLCVESTWTHGSLAALDRFFGASVDPERGKPTNREFLCRVQERLTLTMQRLL